MFPFPHSKPVIRRNYYDGFFNNRIAKTVQVEKQKGTGIPIVKTKVVIKEEKKPLPGSNLIKEYKKLNKG
jgi:hypothetical protein